MSKTPDTFDATQAYDEFEHVLRTYYAYIERTEFDVDAHLHTLREAAIQAHNAHDFRRVLHKATFAFTDPHLLVGPFEDQDPNIWPTSADLVVGLQSGVCTVLDVRAESAADSAGILPEWVITHVDGVSIDDAIRALLDPFEATTDRQRAYTATLLVNGQRSGSRSLTVHPPDRVEPFTVDLESPRVLAKAVEKRAPLHVYMEGETCVVRIQNALGRLETVKAFDNALEEHLDAPHLVLDLRNTPSGGNTDVARGIIGHFIQKEAPYQVHKIPGIERLTTVPRLFVEYVLPRAPYFRGRVAVLGGFWTGSMGEGIVIGMHAAAKAKTFASTMGRLLGAVSSVPMKHSSAVLELGTETLFHVCGTPREEFVADVALVSSDRDACGEDPALREALAWLRS